MNAICARARYDWVIALVASFPILEGGERDLGRRFDEMSLRSWYHESGIAEVSVAHQTTRNALLQQLVTFTRSFHEPYRVQMVARGEVEGRASRGVTNESRENY